MSLGGLHSEDMHIELGEDAEHLDTDKQNDADLVRRPVTVSNGADVASVLDEVGSYPGSLLVLDSMFAGDFKKTGVKELREVIQLLALKLNTVLVERDNAREELGNARMRISRMSLERIRAVGAVKRELDVVTQQSKQLGDLANYNGSRVKLLEGVVLGLANGLGIYASAGAWNQENQFLPANAELAASAIALAALTSPVNDAVISELRGIENGNAAVTQLAELQAKQQRAGEAQKAG
jgi:hypothetical protein